MLQRMLLILTFGMIASAAHAGNSGENRRKLDVSTGNSAENRQKLDVQVETHIGVNGVGAGIGFFLPGDRRLDFSYSMFRLSFLGNEVLQKTYRLELQSFVSNSFYYTLGATHQRYDFRQDDYFDFENAYDDTLHSSGAVNGLHAAIGNEWQWEHFFIGAEWAGVMVPLSSSYKNTYGDDISETTREDWERDSKKVGSRTALILLNLFLGFSF